MRELADRDRIERLMDALGRSARGKVQVYLVGGATSVLMGWRRTTIAVDLVMRPEDDAVLRAIPDLKERLHVNVELASPLAFIPVPSGWESRSPFIAEKGKASFHHFDLYAQALAKVERGHDRDLFDVREMLARELIDSRRALDYFAQIEPDLYRFPAIDSPAFRRAVESAFTK